MQVGVDMARGTSSKASREVSFTPELQRSQSFFGDSEEDDDSVHPTPSDSTAPLHIGIFPNSNGKGSTTPIDREEEARQIHYIDSLFDANTVTPELASYSAAAMEGGPFAAATASYQQSSSHSSTLAITSSNPKSHSRKRGRPRKCAPSDTYTSTSVSTNALGSQERASAPKRKRLSTAIPSKSLSMPDFGQFLPHESNELSSGAAQGFIKNNLKLFADLLSALDKQAPRDEASHGTLTSCVSDGSEKRFRSQSDLASTHELRESSPKLAAPEDDLRVEVKKRMAEVALGHDGLREELVKMNVDMHFYENAHKTVDERIHVLRERIAKRSITLQQEREVTRKTRDEDRKSKRDRKAAQADASRLEEDLEHNVMRAESPYEGNATPVPELPSFDSILAQALAPTAAPAPTNYFDRGVVMSDEELAKVLGISTHDLAGFSTALELASDSNASRQTALNPNLPSGSRSDQHNDSNVDETTSGHNEPTSENFDVAAFLEMASAASTTDTC